MPKSAKIIEVCSADSRLVGFLLDEGFENITVLDVSAKALESAKTRIGKQAEKVSRVISDITDYHSQTVFDCRHDRATFHFLTTPGEIAAYLETSRKTVNEFMIIGTFSDSGPTSCSEPNIRQYIEFGEMVVSDQTFETLISGTDKQIADKTT